MKLRGAEMCVAVLGWLLAGCGDVAESPGDEASPGETAAAVVNGTELSADEAFERGILSVKASFGFLDPDKEPLAPVLGGPCSATVIGPQWVVTARHCLWDGGPDTPGTVPPKPLPTPAAGGVLRGTAPYAAHLELRAGTPGSGIRWTSQCDLSYLNTPLSMLAERRASVPVLPPGPARAATAKADKAAAKLGSLGRKQNQIQKERAQAKRCVVWLDDGPLDLAYVSLPPAMTYPRMEAGAVLFDGDVGKEAADPLSAKRDVEVFGYAALPPQKEWLRTGKMRLEPPSALNKYEKPAGYVEMGQLPTPPQQFLFPGDSGGPTMAAAAPGQRSFLQVGVNSHGTFATGSQQVVSPSVIIPPAASIATLLFRWFEKESQFRHTGTLVVSFTASEVPHAIDWNGDGRTDVVAVGPSATRVWLATPSGFAQPFSRDYNYSAAAAVTLDPTRALPARLRAPDGVVYPSLVFIDQYQWIKVFIDEGEALGSGGVEGQLPSKVGLARTPDNMRVVRVSQTAEDELLFVDPYRLTLVPSGAGKFFNPAKSVTTELGIDEAYGDDFTVADVNGDGRTDFVYRAVDRVEVLTGLAGGVFGGGTVTPFPTKLPGTAGIRFVDLNHDGRDDLVWIDRQTVAGGTTLDPFSDGRRIHVRLASAEKPGALGAERVFPIELGDAWAATDDPTAPVRGYDLGDVTGDGHVDLVHVGTFGQRVNSGGVVRIPAIFVKPGGGDGTFAEMRVWRLLTGKLGTKNDLAQSFYLEPTTSTSRADVVFSDGTFLDVVISQ